MYKADKIVDNSKTVARQKAQFVASLFPIHWKKVVSSKVEKATIFLYRMLTCWKGVIEPEKI